MELASGLVLSVLPVFYLSMLIRWVAGVFMNYKQYESITGTGNFRRFLSIVGTRDSGKMGVHKHCWAESGVPQRNINIKVSLHWTLDKYHTAELVLGGQ